MVRGLPGDHHLGGGARPHAHIPHWGGHWENTKQVFIVFFILVPPREQLTVAPPGEQLTVAPPGETDSVSTWGAVVAILVEFTI